MNIINKQGGNMRFELKNVGKIKMADIKLDGITVIAGENNTGKSTVGKMLYCVFDSFFKGDGQVKKEREKAIARAIFIYYHEISHGVSNLISTDDFAFRLIEDRERYIEDVHSLKSSVRTFYNSKDVNFEKYYDEESFDQLIEKIISLLSVKDNDVRRVILKKRLDAEFAMKISHLNHLDEKTEVRLSIKNSNIDFLIENNKKINLKNYVELVKDIIYIDNPFVLDNMNNNAFYMRFNRYTHNANLIRKLTSGNSELSALDEIVVNKKLDKILDTMSDVCDGELLSNEGTDYLYKSSELNGDLDIVNLSTGMKSFVIIRELLQNGSIDDKGIIILDEPEIHLHPEWQLKFAEIIVLIQKEFNANILLNTHSPYFLNAIEVYSKKYGVKDNCNYYMTKENGERSDIIDVTDNIELIYEKLAKPLQILENMEYGDEIRRNTDI